MSIGYPTPIKYLGLFFGKYSQQSRTILKKSLFAYPPAKPPIAYPLASFEISCSRHLFLKSGSIPPCTMGNKFCLYGFWFAARFLSIHLHVLCIASSIRAPTVVVFTTSSKAIIISDPMAFWILIESYGRINIFVWLYGF